MTSTQSTAIDGLLKEFYLHSIAKSFVHDNCRICSPFKVFFSQYLCQDSNHFYYWLPAADVGIKTGEKARLKAKVCHPKWHQGSLEC